MIESGLFTTQRCTHRPTYNIDLELEFENVDMDNVQFRRKYFEKL